MFDEELVAHLMRRIRAARVPPPHLLRAEDGSSYCVMGDDDACMIEALRRCGLLPWPEGWDPENLTPQDAAAITRAYCAIRLPMN
jgi:hypothetical protein